MQYLIQIWVGDTNLGRWDNTIWGKNKSREQCLELVKAIEGDIKAGKCKQNKVHRVRLLELVWESEACSTS